MSFLRTITMFSYLSISNSAYTNHCRIAWWIWSDYGTGFHTSNCTLQTLSVSFFEKLLLYCRLPMFYIDIAYWAQAVAAAAAAVAVTTVWPISWHLIETDRGERASEMKERWMVLFSWFSRHRQNRRPIYTRYISCTVVCNRPMCHLAIIMLAAGSQSASVRSFNRAVSLTAPLFSAAFQSVDYRDVFVLRHQR